jgi:WD40 repeat protein
LLVFSKIVCARGVTSICAISDNQLIVGGGDGTLTLLYVEEPKCDELIKINLFGGVFSISPSPDGVQLLASTDKGFIYRVRTIDLSNILLNENHTDSIIAFHSLNDRYYRFGTCSIDGTIRLWNLIDYSVYSRFSIGGKVLPLCLTFRDDLLISGWNDGVVRCLNTSNSERIIIFIKHFSSMEYR